MTEPHPDDIEGPITVEAGGIEWTIYVDQRLAPDSIILVNHNWMEKYSQAVTKCVD